PSFKGLIYRTQRDRILDADEETALLDAYPPWLKRLSIVAKETCLSEDSLKRCVSRKTLSNWRRALEGKKHVSLTRHKHVTPTHVEEVVRFTDDENDRKKWASPGCRQKVAREQVTDTQKSVAKVADFVEARPGQKRPVATLPLIRRFGAFRRRNHCRLTGAW
ncbi:MAG: hypothetical protein Q8S00_04745, partial [Deltaproteobacteria bacterium]|nr:hypothetical protein [Deltaproteobacteria bacterium]